MNSKYIILYLCLSVALKSFTQITSQVKTELSMLKFYESVDFDYIQIDNAESLEIVGQPNLPIYMESFVIPLDAKVTGIRINKVSKQKLPGTFRITPAQSPIPISIEFAENKDTFAIDHNIYNSSKPFPGKYAEIVFDRIDYGYHIITVRSFPVEYIPKTGEMYICDIDYEIEYSIISSRKSTTNKFVSNYLQNLSKKQVRFQVKNKLDIERCAGFVQPLASTISTTLKYAPEYIIITADSLAESFSSFAEWKNKKGVHTIIKTLEDIEKDSRGNDTQEKIRNYLKGLHSKWGSNAYVLLGGDSEIIPPRLIENYDKNGQNPSDYYYATTDGTWNKDNDMIFGEDENIAYGYTFNVGRAPVNNKVEVKAFSDKVINYEKAIDVSDKSYYKNILISDAFITRCSDKDIRGEAAYASLKEYQQKYMPSNIKPWYLFDNYDCSNIDKYSYSTFGDVCCYNDGDGYRIYCPNSHCVSGDEELSRNNFLNALNNGNATLGKFHIIYHMDHSKINGLGTSSKDKGEGVQNEDFDKLFNGNYYQIFISGSCSPATFTYDCIAEHYLNNQNGGGVAFIGNADVGHSNEYNQFKGFLNAIYPQFGNTNLGRYDIGAAYQQATMGNSSYRKRLHLLGDPEMQVWTDTPKNMTVQINPVETMPCGEGTVNVTVSGIQQADEEVRICLYKKDEVFAPVTVEGNGTHTFTGIHPLTPGDLYVTITAHNYLPVEDTITVTANPNQHVYFKELAIDDDNNGSSRGNGNGQADAGETLELSLTLANNGLEAARGVTATLGCTSPYVTVHTAQVAYGDIAAGGTATPKTQYVVQIDPDMPETAQGDPDGLAFTLEVTDADGHSFSGMFGMDVYADELHLGNRSFVGDGTLAPGRTVQFDIALQNTGKATATGLQGTLKDAEGHTVCTRTYPAIGQNEAVRSTVAYAYTLPATYTGGSLPMTLEMVNEYGKAWAFPLDLSETRLPVPTGANFTADLTSINLYWDVQPDVAGYNVYRCDVDGSGQPTDNYTRCNTSLLSFSYFLDEGLARLTTYHYRITAVSASGLEGKAAELTAWTSLQTKGIFPVVFTTDVGMRSGCVPIDINGDGKQELFSAGRNGYVVALDWQGNELFDIDHNMTTYGGFAEVGAYVETTPAIGRIFGDDKYYLIVAKRCDANSQNRIICFSMEDNDGDSKPDIMWEKTVSNSTMRGVVLANVDNSADGTLELIVCHETGGPIRVLSAFGEELYVKGGIETRYAAVAVADLDGDGDMEIVAPGWDGIYVWHHDFTPFETSERIFTESGCRFSNSIVICDIDQDGQKEILTKAVQASPYAAKTYVMTPQGVLLDGWADDAPWQKVAMEEDISDGLCWTPDIAVGDLDHDGDLEVVIAGVGEIKILSHTGEIIKEICEDNLYPYGAGSLILADVDADDDVEVVATSEQSNFAYAFNMDGSPVLGFPLTLTGDHETHYGTPAVSDIDNDGKNELMVNVGNYMYVFPTEGKPQNIEWGMERHDPHNTGEYTRPCFSERVTSNVVWTESRSICGDLDIYPESSLTVEGCTIDFGSASTLTIHEGASLEIDGATLQGISVDAKPGSSFKLHGNGKIHLREGGLFETGKGTIVEIVSGEIKHLIRE